MYFKMNGAPYGNILICISLDIMTVILFCLWKAVKEILKINVVYLIKLVIFAFHEFKKKYDLSLMSYFIIAVLVGFIVRILIKTIVIRQ